VQRRGSLEEPVHAGIDIAIGTPQRIGPSARGEVAVVRLAAGDCARQGGGIERRA
jgi:hypothetical protein